MKIDAETLKKQVILHLPYVLFLLVFAKLGEAVRLAPGADASQKLLGLSEGFALAFQSMWPGAAMDWLIGFCGAAIMRLAVYLRGKDAKKYRKNVEYGSARWGNKADTRMNIRKQSLWQNRLLQKMKKGWWAKWQEKAENRRQRLCRHHLYMYMWLCISVFLWRITKSGAAQ